MNKNNARFEIVASLLCPLFKSINKIAAFRIISTPEVFKRTALEQQAQEFNVVGKNRILAGILGSKQNDKSWVNI